MLKFYHAVNFGNVTFMHVLDAGHAGIFKKKKMFISICILCLTFIIETF